jgi:hypothetical protein
VRESSGAQRRRQFKTSAPSARSRICAETTRRRHANEPAGFTLSCQQVAVRAIDNLLILRSRPSAQTDRRREETTATLSSSRMRGSRTPRALSGWPASCRTRPFRRGCVASWIPAFAGMTSRPESVVPSRLHSEGRSQDHRANNVFGRVSFPHDRESKLGYQPPCPSIPAFAGGQALRIRSENLSRTESTQPAPAHNPPG